MYKNPTDETRAELYHTITRSRYDIVCNVQPCIMRVSISVGIQGSVTNSMESQPMQNTVSSPRALYLINPCLSYPFILLTSHFSPVHLPPSLTMTRARSVVTQKSPINISSIEIDFLSSDSSEAKFFARSSFSKGKLPSLKRKKNPKMTHICFSEPFYANNLQIFWGKEKKRTFKALINALWSLGAL